MVVIDITPNKISLTKVIQNVSSNCGFWLQLTAILSRQSPRLKNFDQWGHFVMLITRNFNLITVQSWTYLACENSRPSSLPARVTFASRETPLGPGAKKDGCFRRLGHIWMFLQPSVVLNQPCYHVSMSPDFPLKCQYSLTQKKNLKKCFFQTISWPVVTL